MSDLLFFLKDLSTSLVKLSAQYEEETFKSVLTRLREMNFDMEDCIEWLLERKMNHNAALVYKHMGESEKSVNIWTSLLENDGQLESAIDSVIDSLAKYGILFSKCIQRNY